MFLVLLHFNATQLARHIGQGKIIKETTSTLPLLEAYYVRWFAINS